MFFPYATVSEFFEEHGDFPENLGDDEADCLQEDPFGFTQAINWDVVDNLDDEQIEEVAKALHLDEDEPHVCDGDCDPGNCEVAHHDHFWGEQDNPR